MKQRVCIIQPVMKGYRLPFFRGLHHRLASEAVDLEVAYGTPWPEEVKRGDNVELEAPPGRCVPSRLIGGKVLWIPAFSSITRADRLIVEHANKNVINYPLAIVNALGIKRVAYWGHGRNRQGNPNSLSERFKNRSLHWADWWFAYTAGAAEYVASQGFDAKRITSVGNAVDTKVLRAEVAAVSNAERAALLEELKWGPSVTRLVYCGSLYGNKRLDLLLLAAEAVQARIPTLQLLVMGGGPQANEVSRFAATRPWVRYVGPQFGRRKAAMLSLAQLWVNPGLVGLGILDAFSAGLPIVTTDVPVHSPEIEYLVHGVNGLMVPATVADLAAALEALLRDPEQVQRLRDGARASADHYSIETMVDNFAQGVLQWLRS